MLNYSIDCAALEAQTAPVGDILYSIILLLDTAADGTLPTVSDVLGGAGTNQYTWDKKNLQDPRYRILKRKNGVIPRQNTNEGAVNSFAVQAKHVQGTFNVPLSFAQRYKTGGGGNLSDIQDKAIHVMFICSDGTNTTLTYGSTFSYKS